MKSRIFGTEMSEENIVNLRGPDETNISAIPADSDRSAGKTVFPDIPAERSPAGRFGESPLPTGSGGDSRSAVESASPVGPVESGSAGGFSGGSFTGSSGGGSWGDPPDIPADGGSSGGASGGGIRDTLPVRTDPVRKESMLGDLFRRFTQASFRLGSKKIPVWAVTIIALLVVIIVIIAAGNSSSGGSRNPAVKYREQFELMERFENAYNKHDYYAMFECFDPAVMQFYSGMISIGMSLSGANISSSDLQAVMPGLSQMFGASGFLDEAAGQIDFQPFNFVGNDAGGIIVYHVKLRKNSGNEEFDQAAELIKVDGKWYFSSTQRDQDTLMKMVEENKYEAGTTYDGIIYGPGSLGL